MYTIRHTNMDACIEDSMHTTVGNKSYYGQHKINAIHKVDLCMWNICIRNTGVCGKAMASNAW